MDFIWHDGGRAACGFVGSTGDCVTRCIAIATGEVYRDVYESLGSISGRTARNGVSDTVINEFLAKRGWKSAAGMDYGERLPKGVLIVQFTPVASRKRTGHLSCIVDHTVYDTWNPMEDPEYQITSIWTREQITAGTTLPSRKPGSSPVTEEARLTQNEYEKILKRVKALDRTASNHASTEGEIRNALRAMQSLMLKHNLSRNDLVEDDDVSETRMTRRACPLNGSKAYQWESFLAHYLTEEVFHTVQFYRARRGHRTLFWFYGPVDDVEQILGLFRELLLTIATAAYVKYGSHTRGSGASYAEGYVNGLPRTNQNQPHDSAPISEAALIHARTLAIHNAAKDWLDEECGIRLRSSRSSGRGRFDESAHRDGKRDGARHEHAGRHARKQITHYRKQ